MLFICLALVPRPLLHGPLSPALRANDGRLLTARVANDGQWRLQPADSVPRRFQLCLLTYEDARYRYHLGLDPLAMLRALAHNLRARHVVEGGSTITQQLARMALGNRRRTLPNKLYEAAVALGIELRNSKPEILRLYCSAAPFGGNVVGLEAAAWRYFGRSADQLSWAEGATLAVLPNAPALVNVGRNRKQLKLRRDKLLRKLAARGHIDEATLELALDEPLPEKPTPMPTLATHLLDHRLRNGLQGTADTDIDPFLQSRVQGIADQHRAALLANRVNDIGIIVLNLNSLSILAYVGNASPNSPTCRCDMVQAPRSSGSTLKPFLLTAMLAAGEVTPHQLIADTPLDINGFAPQNYSHTFSGAVPAAQALTQSLNVPLVRMLQTHGVGRFLVDLRALGFTTLTADADHYGAALILGGAEVTLYDLAKAYGTIARSLLYDEQKVTMRRRYTPSAVWQTFQALTSLSRPEEEAEWRQFASMRRVAWKTGTSYGGRDAWAVGVTPGNVVGVWVGNATGEGRAGLTGVGAAAPVLFDVISLLPPTDWFPEPYDDEEHIALCHCSGYRAGPFCADIDTLRLPRTSVSAPSCPHCRTVALSESEDFRGDRDCLPPPIHIRSWFALPPAQEWYYQRQHPEYRPLPPLHPGCADQEGTLEFIYPSNGITVVRTRNYGGELQPVVAQAAVSGRGQLFWHLDNLYLGSTEGEHKMPLAPQQGRHHLTVVNEYGTAATVVFNVK